jgi:hypothetical protein
MFSVVLYYMIVGVLFVHFSPVDIPLYICGSHPGFCLC